MDKNVLKNNAPYGIAVHGGAGLIAKNRTKKETILIQKTLYLHAQKSLQKLSKNISALDVVENVVAALENMPELNAGKGSVFRADGSHELDAAIADGFTRHSGAAIGVKTIKNPIKLARKILENSPHSLLCGKGAEDFGGNYKVDRVSNDYFFTQQRFDSLKDLLNLKKENVTGPDLGTVGAVALDKNGHLAAATSTGGTTAASVGRVGDSPIIGAGTWADKNIAISCTGYGELFLENCTAHKIAMRIELLNEGIKKSCSEVMQSMKKGSGGFIAIDRLGNWAMPFNTEGMFRAVATHKTDAIVGSFKKLSPADPSYSRTSCNLTK